MANKKRVDGRSLPRNVMEHNRLRAVELYKKGWAIQDIAYSFGVNRGSVSRWMTLYRRNGIDVLKKRKAPGSKRKLSMVEQKELISCIKKLATDFGFETPLWDCHRIQQLIFKLFNKHLHMSNVWRLLHAWNLTLQKPERRAIEQNKKIVKKWLKEEWPEILKHAKRWQAITYFQDEAGVSLIPVLGKTWAPKGETPIVPVTGKRGGLCVTSAISPKGRLIFRIEKEKVNSKRHVEFLNQILKHHPNRKIIVIEDRAPVHRGKYVNDFVQEHKNRFALYYLPSYSPDLNPDEKTWGYLKDKKLKSHQVTTTEQLRELVLSKMRSIQRQPKIVKSFFYNSIVT